ncbi:hypothetical protein T11_14801 [Trichinella zimbabwensis]|uniref:Uncharacterized protein n=1 Tax=Trichinella zimbabwensis TaxID=268475 RepID=A0A0V1HIZ0_9BILA|nr:hypothetical protein T11_14801 [Trichinella zimbabwensis]
MISELREKKIEAISNLKSSNEKNDDQVLAGGMKNLPNQMNETAELLDPRLKENATVKCCRSAVELLAGEFANVSTLKEQLFLKSEKNKQWEEILEPKLRSQIAQLQKEILQKSVEWKKENFDLQLKIKELETDNTMLKMHVEKAERLLVAEKGKCNEFREKILTLEKQLFAVQQAADRQAVQSKSVAFEMQCNIERLQQELQQAVKQRDEQFAEQNAELEKYKNQSKTLLQDFTDMEIKRKETATHYQAEIAEMKQMHRNELKQLDETLLKLKLQNHTEKVSYEHNVATLLLETKQLRWERDKALEELVKYKEIDKKHLSKFGDLQL